MPFGLGLRFVGEAVFIVAVAVAAGLAGFSTWEIVLVMGIAWVLASGIEWTAAHRHTIRPTEHAPAPRTDPVPELAAAVLESEPGLEPIPPPLVSVPAPPPEPKRQFLSPKREAVVPMASRDARAREWNVWELERLARSHARENPAQEEDLGFLLMYLREFANADGVLPLDFDPLVRDSFAEILAAPTR